ncbi:host cell division inhibitor Icd-like protein [Pantoea sp.]|uniref:host cell division inhibitor Icd-like protein n=1 Tax=Pantoea sp. TaxID=69393 RepID=UPI0028ADA8FE|nr:host cell division inhibitor Icd-like protein [Pantoea sp.]
MIAVQSKGFPLAGSPLISLPEVTVTTRYTGVRRSFSLLIMPVGTNLSPSSADGNHLITLLVLSLSAELITEGQMKRTAGLLSNVMVFDLAKLSLNLTKPNIRNLNKPETTECKAASYMLDHAVCSALSFETSTRAGVLRPVRVRERYPAAIKKGLPDVQISDYPHSAPAKSGVGIGLPDMYKATHDAPGVFFCVLDLSHPFFSDTVIIRVAHKVMVGWVVASSEAPVSLYAGKTNSAQSTTSKIGLFGGGIKYQYKEAATMATTLTQGTPKFQFRFLALSRADMLAKPCRVSVEATSEKEARRVLAPHFILSLAARLPVQEARP